MRASSGLGGTRDEGARELPPAQGGGMSDSGRTDLHDVPLVNDGDALAALLERKVHRGGDEALGPLLGHRLDAEAGGPREADLRRAHRRTGAQSSQRLPPLQPRSAAEDERGTRRRRQATPLPHAFLKRSGKLSFMSFAKAALSGVPAWNSMPWVGEAAGGSGGGEARARAPLRSSAPDEPGRAAQATASQGRAGGRGGPRKCPRNSHGK